MDKNTRDEGWGVKKSYTLMWTSIFRRKKTLYTDVDKYTRDGGRELYTDVGKHTQGRGGWKKSYTLM